MLKVSEMTVNFGSNLEWISGNLDDYLVYGDETSGIADIDGCAWEVARGTLYAKSEHDTFDGYNGEEFVVEKNGDELWWVEKWNTNSAPLPQPPATDGR